MRELWRKATYFAILAGALALHLALVRSSALPQALVPGCVSLACICAIVFLEHRQTYRPSWRRNLGDFTADFISTNLVLPFVVLGSQRLWMATGWLYPLLPRLNNFFLETLAALLLAELGFYLVHRLAHRSALLWRLHSIHHGAERVYWANAGRFHPIDVALNFVVYFAPIIVLGAPRSSLLLISTLNAVTGFLEHANIDFDVGPLNRIFNTAQLHRWHHSTEARAHDVNHGKVLSVWDSVFGSYLLPPEGVGTVGLAPGEPKVPVRYLAQLAWPFRRR